MRILTRTAQGTMKRRKRKLGPWELSHRTYSFRAPPELRDRIEALRKGETLQGVLLKGLGLVQVEAAAEAYNTGFSKGKDVGEKAGYARGKADWEGVFEVPCNKCNKPLPFDMKKPKDREDVQRSMKTWHHTKCSP